MIIGETGRLQVRADVQTDSLDRVRRNLDFQDTFGRDRRSLERTALCVEKHQLAFQARR